MKVIEKLLVGSLFLASFAITMAQEGDRSPSFDDPARTVIFPQFIVGNIGGFSFDIEKRIGNGSDLPFSGTSFILRSDLSSPVGLLVNGAPYNPAGIPINLGPKESMSLFFSVANGNRPQGDECEVDCGCDDCLDADDRDSDGPAGTGASVSDLTYSFFYNLRDAQGNLIDSVAVPEARAGKGIRFVMSRRPGFDTGVAIFITIPQPVGIRVYLPGGASPAGTTLLEGVNPLLTKFRDDCFLNEFIQNLPAVIESTVVEIFVEIGEIYGMALGVKVEGTTVQLSGQNVTPFGLNGGAPFNDQ